VDSPEVKRVNELLQKKIRLVETLLFYAKQQSELSYTDNPVTYDNIIISRANIIEDLKKVDAIIQHSLEAARAMNKAGDVLNQSVNEVNDQISVLARQIMVLDEKSQTLMAGEVQMIKNKLRALGKGKKGLKGYHTMGTGLSPSGAYTDSKR
jgi:hypothetical protein